MRSLPFTGNRLILAYFVFTVSGFCGLGYQMIWSRMFAFGLGHEVPAVLAVVAAFFAGLSAGALALARPIGKSHRPGLWYAGLEIAIGAWGLITIVLLPLANDLALSVTGLEPSAVYQWTIAFVVPFFALAPATFAMGATLPAMERLIAQCCARSWCVGGLYAANTLGAMLGTLGTTFLVLPAFAFSQALQIYGVTCILSGVAAGLIFRSVESHCSQPGPAAQAPEISVRRVYLTLFATGLLGLGFEIVGIRILSQIFENTVYSYAAALSVYLGGTALGAAVYQRAGRSISIRSWLNLLLLGLAISIVIGGLLLFRFVDVYERIREKLGDSVLEVLIAELSIATLIFGIPTLFMGALFSHLVQSARGDAGQIGRAVAVNTLGCALAPVVVGIGVFPVAGSSKSLAVIAAAYLILLTRPALRHRVGVGLAFVLILSLPKGAPLVQKPPGAELVEFREGVRDSVAVVKSLDGNRSLIVNNRFTMGGTGAAIAARRHAHVPLLLHPAPNRALFLGLGTGISFAGAVPYPELEADGVELVPEIIEALHLFAPENALRPGLKVYRADARRFVRVTQSSYDVIVSDLFHPARDGAGGLYTFEHFQSIRDRLARGGLFCQWLPLFQLDESVLRIITRTFIEVFPEARAFLLRFNTVDTPVLGLIGTLELKRYPSDWFRLRVRDSELLKQLKTDGLVDEFQLFGCYVAGPGDLRAFARGAPINSDNQPVVTFEAPRFSFHRDVTPYGRLLTLVERGQTDVRELIENDRSAHNEKFIHDLADFTAARNVFLHGLVAESQGHSKEAIDAFIESARRSPIFSTGYAHCLAFAVQQSKSDPEASRSLLRRLAEAQPSRPVARELLKRMFNE